MRGCGTWRSRRPCPVVCSMKFAPRERYYTEVERSMRIDGLGVAAGTPAGFLQSVG